VKRFLQGALERVGVGLHRWPSPNTLLKHLDGTLRRLEIDCVVDVGANLGQYARSLRRIGYRGWVLSFEPVPENVAHLERLAHEDGRWRVFPYALGDTEGEVALHVAALSDFSSILNLSGYGAGTFTGATVSRSLQVPIHRLDAVFDELLPGMQKRRVFLKSDTQGYDLHVLRGAQGCLHRVLGVQIELSLQPIYDGMPDIADALRALRYAGYDPVGFAPVSTDPSGAVVELDCVAQRRDWNVDGSPTERYQS
jgi:FkbM family methyltransferase